jgi:hypothetical protein
MAHARRPQGDISPPIVFHEATLSMKSRLTVLLSEPSLHLTPEDAAAGRIAMDQEHPQFAFAGLLEREGAVRVSTLCCLVEMLIAPVFRSKKRSP